MLILENGLEAPSIELFRQLKWIPIHNLIKMRKIIFVFNFLKTSWPQDLSNLFSFLRESHDAYIRSSITDLKLPQVKSEIAKFQLSYSGAMPFNSLPNELKKKFLDFLQSCGKMSLLFILIIFYLYY